MHPLWRIAGHRVTFLPAQPNPACRDITIRESSGSRWTLTGPHGTCHCGGSALAAAKLSPATQVLRPNSVGQSEL